VRVQSGGSTSTGSPSHEILEGVSVAIPVVIPEGAPIKIPEEVPVLIPEGVPAPLKLLPPPVVIPEEWLLRRGMCSRRRSRNFTPSSMPRRCAPPPPLSSFRAQLDAAQVLTRYIYIYI